MTEYGFSVETIDLPSEGKYYPTDSPLASGKIDIKYMTAKEEDILTSTNLIQKGIVIDRLMESLVVSKGVSPNDLLVGDLNAVLVASRILAYGKEYPIQLTCTVCEAKFEHTVDLSNLNMINPKSENTTNQFELTLPTGVKITFKLLTRRDEKEIKVEVDALNKFNNSVDSEASTRLKYIITSVNGNTDKKIIKEFSESMIIRDVRALRQEIKRVSPDIDFDLKIVCNACGEELKVRMPLGANFFWPDL